jgi:hypothetical protein
MNFLNLDAFYMKIQFFLFLDLTYINSCVALQEEMLVVFSLLFLVYHNLKLKVRVARFCFVFSLLINVAFAISHCQNQFE